MNLESDKRLNIQLRLDFSSAPKGEARQAGREDIGSLSAVDEPERPANTSRIMEEVCERANLKEALRQVRANKGSAGVDQMTVDQLGDYLKQHWPAIREQLLSRTYKPKPVRGWKSRSRMEEGCESLASPPCWIDSFSKP
jgi:RNA-directed DNA polymerase